MVSKSVVWPRGRTFVAFVNMVADQRKAILEGTMLAIDPSSKSLGWALYKSAELVDSGTIVLTDKAVNRRLQALYDKLNVMDTPDLLVMEKIQGNTSHDYLKYSVGVGMAAIRTDRCILVPISAWKKVVAEVPNYIKTDENDAILIGYTAIRAAEECCGGS